MNEPLTVERDAEVKATYDERRRLSWRSGGGSPYLGSTKMAMEVSPEERRAAFEKRWQLGGVLFSKTFPVFLTAGWDGDVMVARANAPINQTHSGPYVGLGFRF